MKKQRRDSAVGYQVLCWILGLVIGLLAWLMTFELDIMRKGEVCLRPLPNGTGWIWERIPCDPKPDGHEFQFFPTRETSVDELKGF